MAIQHRIGAILFIVVGLIVTSQVNGAGSVNLTGTVYLVDNSAHTLTLKNATGTLTTLTVTTKSKILRNGKKVALTGLVLGDQGTAIADGSNALIQLSVKGATVTTIQGGVAGLSSGTGTVQIKSGKKIKSAQTTGNTRVMRNGQLSSLNSLTSFDTITSHVTKSTSTAATVQNALDIQAEGPEETEIKGTISAVTAATPGDPTAVPPVPPAPATVTITPNTGAPVTLIVTANTLINVGGATGTAADLTVGMLVEAEYDPVTLEAFHIEAENEEDDAEIEGTITALDAVSCTLSPTTPCTVTITNEKGSVTLIVNASTKIKSDDASALLSDLKIGDPASAEFNAVTLFAQEIEVENENGDGQGGNSEGGEND